jgi:hypothetical protein
VSAIQKRPLTAYQKQRRKELGLEVEEELTLDQQLARLEVDIRRLKVEFDIFFNGGVKHPPYDTRNRVETTLNRLGDDRSLTYAHRYKYNSLAARFAAFRDMWRRSMQSREEGRDFITVARAKLDAMRKAADDEIASRNEAAARLMQNANTPAPAAPMESPTAVIPPPPPARIATVKPEAPAHREPVHAKAPASLLGLVDDPKRLEPPPPVAQAPAATVEPEGELIAFGSTAGGVSVDETEPAAEISGPFNESADTGYETAQAQPEEAENSQRDEYLGAVYDSVPELSSEDETMLAGADDQAGAESAAPDDREAEPPARDTLRPRGTGLPKILPPTAHQLQPPEPVTRSRRSGDRRSGDRRALPFGRRAVDREAMGGRTPEEFVAQLVNPDLAAPENTAAVEPVTTRVVVDPVPQVQLPPVNATPELPAAPLVPDEEVAVFVFKDPRREPAQVKELFAALINAKIKTGENSDDLLPSRFGHLLALRADKIRKTAKCEQVVFSIAIEDGRVNLNARAEK